MPTSGACLVPTSLVVMRRLLLALKTGMGPRTLELRLGSCVVLVSDSRGCALIFPAFADCFLVPGRSRVFSIDTTIVSHVDPSSCLQ